MLCIKRCSRLADVCVPQTEQWYDTLRRPRSVYRRLTNPIGNVNQWVDMPSMIWCVSTMFDRQEEKQVGDNEENRDRMEIETFVL
jgi:hypothetical protein